MIPQKLKIENFQSQFSIFLLLRKVKLNIILQYFENQKLKIENGQLVVLTFCFQFPLPKIQAIKNSNLTKQFTSNKLQETVLLPSEIQNTEKSSFDFRIYKKQNCKRPKIPVMEREGKTGSGATANKMAVVLK